MLITLVLQMHLGALELCVVTSLQTSDAFAPCLKDSNTKDVFLRCLYFADCRSRRMCDDSAAPDVCNHHLTSSRCFFFNAAQISVFQKYRSVWFRSPLQEDWELLMLFEILRRDVHFNLTSVISTRTPSL